MAAAEASGEAATELLGEGGVSQSEEDRVTEAQKNQRVKQQLQAQDDTKKTQNDVLHTENVRAGQGQVGVSSTHLYPTEAPPPLKYHILRAHPATELAASRTSASSLTASMHT
ncbi:hypothetical protein CRUP_020659 [Coryphaenoides rupestris]|nr:hypothetical protein CRUP_020659 [Coryphaenoides rupestris]